MFSAASKLSKRSLWLTTSCLLAGGSAALAETDITLGGELGLSASFGLTKTALIVDVAETIRLNIGLANTLDSGLRFGGDLNLSGVDVLQLSPYLDTDPFGVQEKKLFKLTNDVDRQIAAVVYPLSGGDMITAGSIVAVKINSDWISTLSDITEYSHHLLPLRAPNICKMAGTFASKMVGQAANGNNPPAFGADPLETRIGNGLAQGSDIIVERTGATGEYMPPGVFAAKRFIWAQAPLSTTMEVPAAAHNRGARISVNGGSAAVVFETRFPATKITPDKVDPNALPGLVHVQTQSQSATLLFSPGPGELAGDKVNFAQVHIGPVMDVITRSSAEQKVVGAVCLEGDRQGSASNVFIDNATPLIAVAGASIFVEGGFGKLSLSTSDQGGFVTPSETWTDAVAFEGKDNLVLTGLGSGAALADGLSFLLAGQAREDVRSWITIAGAKYDMGDLTLAADLLLDPSTEARVDAWQAEAVFEPFADATLSLGMDSAAYWWAEAHYKNPGFTLSYETGGPTVVTNTERRYWAASGALIINDTRLGVTYDKSEHLSFKFSRDLGAGSLFASIASAGDETDLVLGSTLKF